MRIIIPGLGGENLVPATRSAKNLISCQALDTATLRWLYHYDIPAAVPAQGTISFADLAQKLSLSQRVLTRIVRHAILNNIFAEPTPGNVAHTSLSLQLARPGNSVRGVVGHQTETVFPAVAHMVEAHERNGTQDESVMHTPFHEAFGTPMKPLDWVAADPVRSARFAESMKGGASSGPFNTGHTVRAFDWDSLGDATVVDVSFTVTLASNLSSYPALHCGSIVSPDAETNPISIATGWRLSRSAKQSHSSSSASSAFHSPRPTVYDTQRRV